MYVSWAKRVMTYVDRVISAREYNLHLQKKLSRMIREIGDDIVSGYWKQYTHGAIQLAIHTSYHWEKSKNCHRQYFVFFGTNVERETSSCSVNVVVRDLLYISNAVSFTENISSHQKNMGREYSRCFMFHVFISSHYPFGFSFAFSKKFLFKILQ